MRSLVIAILLTLATIVGACDKDSQPPRQDKPSEAQSMYDQKCARCHGVNGDARGPFSDSLHPRPANYTDPAWQASITDDQIKEIILRGGVNMHKNPAMPGSPMLKNHPEVLDGLVKIIRGFGKRRERDRT
jgi:mono/diheme cytochrome c family protein